MKKLLNGFTLAEVLITLGIIGVIASLTLPNLTLNINKQQVGPALAKAINTLENANKLALQEGGVRTLDQLATDKATYFDNIIAPYLLFKKETIAKPYYQFDYTTALAHSATNVYTTKDGIAFFRPNGQTPTAVSRELKTLPLAQSGSYYIVYVDTNGNNKGPNALGRDVYQLYVDTKGSVFPTGSISWIQYTKGETVAPWTTQCFTSKTVPLDALMCAGAVADNGFKVIHY